MNTLQESFLDAISVLAENSIRKAPGTIVIECVVSQVLNPGLGEYKVTYLGETFSVFASNPNIAFNVNDKVYVLIPNGDFSKQKVIVSASTPNTISYDSSDINKYMPVSDNLLAEVDEIQLCSYRTEKQIIDKNNSKFNVTFPKYLENYSTFAFSAQIKTSIPVEQQINGNYGLILQLPFYSLDAKGDKVELWKSYILDINNISGNPYRLSAWSTQTIFVQINSAEKYDIDRQPQITAFVENFAQKKDKPADIFIKNISFSAYDVLTQENQTGYYLHLAASEGNFFFSEASDESKILTPTLKVNGRNVILSSSSNLISDIYQCYWFKEDASIKTNSEFYSAIGGTGWKCLNKRQNIITNEDGSKSFDLLTNQYTYTVNRKDIITSARFKCVIVVVKTNQDGSTVSTPVTSYLKLENLRTGVTMSVISKTGSNSYIKDIGKVTLVNEIISNDINYLKSFSNYIISYEWNRYDRNGRYIDNDFYEVEMTSDEINATQIIKQEISFDTSLIDDANTFICSAYINYIKDEVSYTMLLGTSSILIDTNGTATYRLIIHNGDVFYKYDIDGNSPLDESYDGPLDSRVKFIKPLTYSIFKSDGTEFTESEYAYCKAEWKVPVRSLIVAESNNVVRGEYYVTEKAGRSEYLYKLASLYNYTKTDNTITLNVRFGDMVLTENAAIKITKEGENGTNNSNYSAVLTHNNVAYGERLTNSDVYSKVQFIYSQKEKKWYYHNLRYKTNDKAELLAITDKDNLQRLDAKVYKSSELISYASEQYKIEWSLFDAAATNPCVTIVANNSTDFSYCQIAPNVNWIDETEVYVNIIQAKITIISDLNNPIELYAYYPIEIIRVDDIELLERTQVTGEVTYAIPTCINGFSAVTYAADGTNPKYNNAEPFTCVDAVFNENGDYNDYEWDCSKNLTKVTVKENQVEIKNKQNFRPVSKYDSSESKNFIKAALTYSTDYKTTLQNKIKEAQDEYSNSQLLKESLIKEKQYLLEFLEVCNFTEIYDKIDYCETFFSDRVKLLNSLKIAEDYLNAAKDYYDYLTDEKKYGTIIYIDWETIYKEIVDVRETIEKGMVNSNGFRISQIQYNPKELAQLPTNIQPVLENYFISFNNYLNTGYDINRIHYLESFNDYSYFFSSLIKLFTDLVNSEPLKNLQNETLIIDEYYRLKYVDLYKHLVTIKNRLTQPNNIYGYTKEAIYDIVDSAIRLIDDYGYYHSATLNSRTIRDFNKRETKCISIMNSASQTIEKLNLSLVENQYSVIYIRPILMTFNRYELSAITGWDGNKLYTGTGNTGDYLYAPQIGAGKKEINGAFTGIVMGNRKVGNNEKVGLFGFYNGEETINLDSQTGSAAFGKSGKGQVIIDPSSNKALIKSGNYSTSAKTGMQIDLTTPEIRFGSGKFVVNSEGELTAKGGGSIAGWKISDTQLYSNKTETNGRITLDIGTNKKDDTNQDYVSYGIYSHKHDTLNSTKQGFYLSSDGLSIGNTIKITATANGQVEIGRISTTKHWIISGDTSNSYIKYGDAGSSGSVYLGTDALTLGSKFSVNSDGDVIAKSLKANVAGEIAGWEITSNALRYRNATTKKGIVIKTNSNIQGGTFDDDWTLLTKDANNNPLSYWQIKQDGTVKFTGGTIGGWTINASTLTAGNVTINSNGTISSGGWSINNNGSASFNNVIVTSTNTTTSKIGNVIIGSDGSISNGNFKVSSSGVLTATGATIKGDITAETGYIGKITISDGGLLYKDSSNTTIFQLSKVGKLTCKDVDLKGKIEATSGSFTGTVNANDGIFNGEIIVKNALKFNGTDGKITFSKDSSAYIRYVDDDTTKAITIYGKDIKITGTSSLILGSTTISGGLNVVGVATIQGGQITVQKSNTESAEVTLTYTQLKALQELAAYSSTLQGLAQTTRKTGSFKDADGNTITVTNGFISNIS